MIKLLNDLVHPISTVTARESLTFIYIDEQIKSGDRPTQHRAEKIAADCYEKYGTKVNQYSLLDYWQEYWEKHELDNHGTLNNREE